MTRCIALALLLLLAVLSGTGTLAGQTLRSPSTQATLLELYTSEGCSSCPPADRWYTSLASNPTLWRTLIPVAFHVDYWNYLGWEDRFAQPEFAQRQRLHKQQGNSRGVYTPGVMALGKEWRHWRRSQEIPASTSDGGILEVLIEPDSFQASFLPAGNSAQTASVLNLALLGFGLQSTVATGENRGKQLQQDFVVLAQRTVHSRNMRWHGQLPTSKLSGQASRLAWAAWVSSANNLAPIQAAGAWAGR